MRFHYLRETVTDVLMQDRLDALGRDGWELVHAERCPGPMVQSPDEWELIFKREESEG